MSKKLANLLRFAHRQGGIVIAVFVILFATTGVLLNHTEFLQLAGRSVPSLIAGRYYEESPVEGFAVAGQHAYVVSGTLYLDRQAVDVCEGELKGAVQLDSELIALCGSDLLILNNGGALLERLGVAHGLPKHILQVGEKNGVLLLELPGQTVSFDVVTISTQPVSIDVAFDLPVAVPASVLVAATVDWEQFILDVHSGRFLGEWGVWLADLLAFLLVLLALTGIVMWLIPRRDNGSGGSNGNSDS